jgi:hypothetical protein
MSDKQTRLGRLARDKCSSLLRLFERDEEKKRFIRLTVCFNKKSFFISKDIPAK